MKTTNEVHLIGRAGKDAEVKQTNSGKTLAKFSLATGGGKRKDGGADYPTDWHNCTAWGDLAELARSIRKGQAIEVYGRISYGSYEKDGVKRYTTDIVVNQIMEPEGDEGKQREAPTVEHVAPNDHGVAITDEDIPF